MKQYLDFEGAKTRRSFGRLDTMVIDIGAPADWVKINVQKTVGLSFVLFLGQCAILLLSMTLYLSLSQIDCYEVYALVPGFLREEVSIYYISRWFSFSYLMFTSSNFAFKIAWFLGGKAYIEDRFILEEEINVEDGIFFFYNGTLLGNLFGCSSDLLPGRGPKEGWGNSGGKLKAIHISQPWKNTYI